MGGRIGTVGASLVVGAQYLVGIREKKNPTNEIILVLADPKKINNYPEAPITMYDK